MERDHILDILDKAPSPAFVVNLGILRENLKILDSVQERTGAKILLALKGFAMFSVFPLIRKTLHGICASSPLEAQLGCDYFGREVHSFAPAYSEADLDAFCQLSDHLVFNSFSQWERHRDLVLQADRPISCGLRLNPEHSEGATAIYDPCAPHSRLGITASQFRPDLLEGIEGFHFHTLCEQNADALARTLDAIEDKFGAYFSKMKWINFGGGHHITRPDYDLDLLCHSIERIQDRYGVQVYLEPGEAVALNAGVLATSVLDIVHNEMDIAILDTSANAHMPDVLEMPYRPDIFEGYPAQKKAFTYRLAGMTCLAGDVIGDWSFEHVLKPGSRLAFMDMAHYSMVKTTMFNGINLPAIATYEPETGELNVIRRFGYEDYKNRLS